MYLSLIDTVTKIVKSYGVGILSDSKFWYVLNDSYSFGSEYTLRDTFKSCIATGYVSRLVSLKGNSKKTKDEISHIVKSESKINPGKEQEYAAALYSIAIAIGSCAKKDYTNFINYKPQTKPSPSPKPKKKPSSQFSKLSKREKWYLLLLIIFGIIASFGGTIFYSAFFAGWWLFFIVLFAGFAQTVYVSSLLVALEDSQHPSFRYITLSVLTPILLAIVCDSIMSFMFFFPGFRAWLSHHIGGWSGDEPTIFSFFLCLLYVFIVGFITIGCYVSTPVGFPDFNLKKFLAQNRVLYVSTAIVLFGYIYLFFYPNISGAITMYKIRKEIEQVEQDYSAQLRTNCELQKQRSNQIMELAFKGIKLGISYETDVQTAEAIPDFANGTERFYSINIDGKTNPANLSAVLETQWIMPDTTEVKKDYFTIAGKVFTGKSTLDNSPIDLAIYEYKNRVPLIIVGFSHDEGSFNQIVSLYSNKYGEAERMTISGTPYRCDEAELYYREQYPYSYSSESNGTHKNDYVWTFKNGFIRISPQKIIYMSNDFSNLLSREYNKMKFKIEQRESIVKDSINNANKRKEALERQKAIDDSIRKSNNHAKAINEI